jgi:hypothetical protein
MKEKLKESFSLLVKNLLSFKKIQIFDFSIFLNEKSDFQFLFCFKNKNGTSL